MKRYLAVLALAALCALPACKREPEPPPAPAALAPPDGFAHEASFDVAGYYTPIQPIQAGGLSLTNLAMGAPSDFQQWEAGAREGLFGPIILDFEDTTSPMVLNELGNEVREVTARPQITAYRVYPGEVSFKATDPATGEIAFAGRFDQAALAAAKLSGNSGTTAVLTGTLQMGDQRFENVGFSYWIGD